MSKGPITAESTFTLAGSNVAIPPLGVGTWAWGDTETWGYQGYDKELGFESIREAYRRALELGVTFFDTAEGYGHGESERILARLASTEPALTERSVIATKFVPFPWRRPFATKLRASLDASLARLARPFVHLYQIHGPISLAPASALAVPLADAYRAGLVKAVGVSNYSEREMRAIHRELSKRGVPLASNQVEYSLLRRMPETSGLLRACRELGVVLLAYSPLGQGRLTGKYSAANPPPGRRNFSDHEPEAVERIVAALRRIGEAQGGKTPAQVALNWLMVKGAVPIPGAKNGAQAEQNAGALGWRLADDDVDALDRLALFGRRTLMHRVWQHG
jgi:aryl-alcohol dehydrogenase-like predicted oxidoreductase